MESWENKIWSDKINSLQDLPEGYLPNLSSKWEIIEAGLPHKKRISIPLLISWSVAAILTGIFLTAIQVNKNNKLKQGMMAAVKMPSLHIPTDVQKEQHEVIAQPAILKNKNLQKAQKQAPVSAAVVVKQDKPPVSNDELKMNPVMPIIDSIPVATDELAIIFPQPETPKRAKQRTFQRDFNDGLLVIDTGYSKPASPQFSFKFQLHKSTGDEAQPSRRLQLKQVL